jgi:hypothetical protein
MGQSAQADFNASAREAAAPFPRVPAHDPRWRRNPARLLPCRLRRSVFPLFTRTPRLRVRQCNMNAGLPMKTAKSTCVSKVQHALTLLHSENASFSSCVAVLHSGNPRRGFRTLTKRQRHSTCARSTQIAPFADCTRSHSNPNAKQARPRIIT